MDVYLKLRFRVFPSKFHLSKTRVSAITLQVVFIKEYFFAQFLRICKNPQRWQKNVKASQLTIYIQFTFQVNIRGTKYTLTKVNKCHFMLAQIIHKHAVESEGYPNKNIGDAFLLVWKLSSTKDGKRSNLQKYMFDAALRSVQKMMSDIKEIGNLGHLMQGVR